MAHEITSPIRIKTAPDYNSALCPGNLNLADLIRFLAPVLYTGLTLIPLALVY